MPGNYCVWWWPNTSWCCPDTNFVSYYTHFEHVIGTTKAYLGMQ
jgi:hypothetical protein